MDAHLSAYVAALAVPQPHLNDVSDPETLLHELKGFDDTYPGGIASYLSTAKKLLDGVSGSSTSEPEVTALEPGPAISAPYVTDLEYVEAEREALPLLQRTAFVLVAGGLGERLGFTSIKIKLPTETATGRTYLQHFAEWIRVVAGPDAPFVIMTSDDTHDLTATMLRDGDDFGLRNIRLLKQETVPCLADPAARLVLISRSTSKLMRKPHGHGDVHTLLHRAGLVPRWLDRGVQHIVFFQDTNAAVTMTVPQTLVQMQRNALDMAFTCVPREKGEAVGALVSAVNRDGTRRVQNVEYNVFDAAYKASKATDASRAGDDAAYPGSINTLLLRLDSYGKTLAATGGKVPEFINPKFTDASKTAFKSPTRVESLMQDIALVLPQGAKVSGVVFAPDLYHPVKNRLSDGLARVAVGGGGHCAATGEQAFYAQRRTMLSACGIALRQNPSTAIRLLGSEVSLNLFPVVVFDQQFAPSVAGLASRFPNPSQVSVSPRSTLVIEGDVVVESLELDGALHLRATRGQRLVVRGLVVSNAGWVAVATSGLEDEVTAIRGFAFSRSDTVCYVAEEGSGETVVGGGSAARSNI
jgi:UDP-sugar pyrophosphorylase